MGTPRAETPPDSCRDAIGDEAWAEQMGARRISIPLREMTSKSSPQVIIITLWVE
jgi:hypothetical protein